MDPARFAQGMTYDEYKARMTRNRERLDAAERSVVVDPSSLAYFRALRPLKVVALAEDWCGDVLANLPVLGVLAREAGTLDVRVFLRDQNEDLAVRWLNHGAFRSIPVFAFFNESFRELGVFIERPAAVSDTRAEEREAVFAANPRFGASDAPVDQLSEDLRVALQAELNNARARTKPFANRAVIFAIRDCIAQAPVR